jgi:hypothetical protein
MNLKEIIAECQSAGVTQIETHPDGSIAKLVFGHQRTQKPEPTPQERIIADKEKREPRRNAMELAEELISDIRKEASA